MAIDFVNVKQVSVISIFFFKSDSATVNSRDLQTLVNTHFIPTNNMDTHTFYVSLDQIVTFLIV